MAGERGKNMSMQQFVDLTRLIMADHPFGVPGGHGIKYIRPHFDTRSGEIYGVRFDGMYGHKEFFVINEDRHRDLTAWIMEFLDTDPPKAGWIDTFSETAKP